MGKLLADNVKERSQFFFPLKNPCHLQVNVIVFLHVITLEQLWLTKIEIHNMNN